MSKRQLKTILPFHVDSIIQTYAYNGFYIGILEGHGIDVTDLLCTEFLHLFYFSRDGGHLDFTGSGYVEPHRFHIKKFKIKGEDYCSYIKKEIANGHYIMVNLNHRYITDARIKETNDFYHDWLIYGYDEAKKSFLCVGYVGNAYQNHVYSSVEIPFEEIKQAIIHIHDYNRSKPLKLINHITYINKKWTEKKWTAEKLRKEILSYYAPHKIDCYHRIFINNDVDGFKKFINSFYEEHIAIYTGDFPQQDNIFLQDFRTIYEHKKVLQIVIERLAVRQEFINAQKKIVDQAYTNLLLSFRYNLHPQKKDALKIYRNLITIEKEERALLERVLETPLPRINWDS